MTIDIDREQFHQMMRRLDGNPHREALPDTMLASIRDVARKLSNATAAQVGGKVTILIEGANEG